MDTISRQAAIDALDKDIMGGLNYESILQSLPSAQPELPIKQKCTICPHCDNCDVSDDGTMSQPEIIRCKDCKRWRQQTNYAGAPLSFGFCESDYMWRSLCGETYEVSGIATDDDFYCGYAERQE